MKTKLVYVLTCAPDGTYIEQALMSVWSARQWNPDAHIVLLTDDKTDRLLVGKRGEILQYISEKNVYAFDEDKDMCYRSRWLKTQCRLFVEGDILYIDCDTVITCPLDEIDHFDCEIGLVPDEHIKVCEEVPSLFNPIAERCRKLGVNHAAEEYYYNGGVMYVKDTETTRELFRKWYQYWEYQQMTFHECADQPPLAKANIECGHLITKIDDVWNTLVPTEVEIIYTAKILHFWSYRNASFLYTRRALDYVKENGLTDYIKFYLLHPTESLIPYDNRVYHYRLGDYYKLYKVLFRGIRSYAENIDESFQDFKGTKGKYSYVWYVMKIHFYRIAAFYIVALKFYRVHSKKYKYCPNICKK